MKMYQCPCCYISSLEERGQCEICLVCGWEDEFKFDDVPDDWEGYKDGANHMTLRAYRAEWVRNGKYLWEKDHRRLPQHRGGCS